MKQQAGNLSMDLSPENFMLRIRTIFSVDITTEQLMMSLFDQVVVLDQGQIIEFGRPMALLADESSAFAKLYRNGGEQSY
jgi:ABC-type multidrug transport system fused ATPase/permease subunit